jgi:Cytochrome c, mono- and diheme variants
MRNHKIKSALVLAIALTLAGCGNKAPEEDSTDRAQIAQGEALFKENCTKCHAHAGRGDYLDRIPATLLTRRSAKELAIWIEGRDMHREMPSFTDLSDQEREALAAYLLSQITR